METKKYKRRSKKRSRFGSFFDGFRDQRISMRVLLLFVACNQTEKSHIWFDISMRKIDETNIQCFKAMFEWINSRRLSSNIYHYFNACNRVVKHIMLLHRS